MRRPVVKPVIIWILRMLPIVGLLAATGTPAAGAPVTAQIETEPLPQIADRTILVEGTVMPERSSTLQFAADGKVAAFTVAGGQGTRLGFDGPKGAFEISPVRNKPLFQLFAEFIDTVLKIIRGRNDFISSVLFE